jgi:hypothetical protein
MMGGCDHHSLAAFSSKNDENYKFIISAIKKAHKAATNASDPAPPMVSEAPREVQGARPGKPLHLRPNTTSNLTSISTRSY